MSAYRPKRQMQSAVNAPVVMHVKGVKAIEKARAEALLTKFISTSEAISSAIVGSEDPILFTNTGMASGEGSNPVLGQLKRVQRDLRGLPPLSSELDTKKEEPVRKKIKFDDEGNEEGDAKEEAQDEEMEEEEEEEEKEDEEEEEEQKEEADEDEEDEIKEQEEDEEKEQTDDEEEQEQKVTEKKDKKHKKDKRDKKEKKDKKDKKDKKEKKHKKDKKD
ncbi:hypothetical protein CLUG_03411 [Clavispora lusitaniae ATCC 42720]|uniref:Uncharacterized protein n=1 Tax=Clavispora lusitaniae (strain ATCC 42720) TaxID=306902 RepID=C4Y5H7_CLAL4|nr:uncharacterized protein CLUG_03411 [Clavispora lusitaniae ATCC 42720]EEQ39283.1 hypothetical protein CLUG_03411 [Clavispora lusitaniae ATCC 42720]KAF5210186.1 hypothetical protein E0198_003053 [Clavispora lusitaniae]